MERISNGNEATLFVMREEHDKTRKSFSRSLQVQPKVDTYGSKLARKGKLY